MKVESQLQLSFEFNKNHEDILDISSYTGLAAFHKYWGKKPIEIWRDLIVKLTDLNDIVLDPFLGSGLIAKVANDLGRSFVGCDVNPISIEMAALFLDPPSLSEIKSLMNDFLKEGSQLKAKLYSLPSGNCVSHVLWHESEVKDVWVKKGRKRDKINFSSEDLKFWLGFQCSADLSKYEFNFFNNSRINSKEILQIQDLFSERALEFICFVLDFLNIHKDKYSERAVRSFRLILTASLGQMSKMVFAISGKDKKDVQVGSWVIGYWRPKQFFEINAFNCFENKANRFIKAISSLYSQNPPTETNFKPDTQILLADAEVFLSTLDSESVALVLTDPPHGDRIPYLELSEIWNGFLQQKSLFDEELVVSDAKSRNKDLSSYKKKFSNIFEQCHRVLKPNGMMVIIFNSKDSDYWELLKDVERFGVVFAGCCFSEYSTGSVVQDAREGALKNDYLLFYVKRGTPTSVDNVRNMFHKYRGWSADFPFQTVTEV